MADINNVTVDETTAVETETNTSEKSTEEKGKDTPSVETLLARMASLEATNKKYKTQIDKYTSELAQKKREERARMSEAEQAEEVRKEQEAERAEYVKTLEAFQKTTLAKDRYLMQGMDVDTAAKAATAEIEGDMDTLSAIQKQHSDSLLKAAQAKWMASRPEVNTGAGNTTITKEQFKNMGMVEQSKLRRENPEEYERLRKLM